MPVRRPRRLPRPRLRRLRRPSRRPSRALSSERGQASLDWIAVVGVVGVALAAGLAGALPGADAVPRAVAGTFERAFCLVSGGDCLDGAPRPCVTRSSEHSRERRVALAVIRLSDGRTLLREDRSDGTVAISVEDGASIGGGVLWGGELTRNGRGVKAAATVRADGRGGRGRRFVVRDGAAADALVARLREEPSGAARLVGGGGALVPDEEWWVLGKGGAADASLKAGRLGATAGLTTATVGGIRERPRTGERTLVLRSDRELVAALTAPLGRLGMGTLSDASVELALDPAGRPQALTVRAARGVHGDVKLGTVRSGGGDLVEAEVRLDLGDPALGRDVDAFLDALRDVAPGRALAAARAVGRHLADRARVDLRRYETERSSKVSGATGGLLVKLGSEVEETTRSARLVDAAGREPGMGWARRLDCVGVGAA